MVYRHLPLADVSSSTARGTLLHTTFLPARIGVGQAYPAALSPGPRCLYLCVFPYFARGFLLSASFFNLCVKPNKHRVKPVERQRGTSAPVKAPSASGMDLCVQKNTARDPQTLAGRGRHRLLTASFFPQTQGALIPLPDVLAIIRFILSPSPASCLKEIHMPAMAAWPGSTKARRLHELFRETPLLRVSARGLPRRAAHAPAFFLSTLHEKKSKSKNHRPKFTSKNGR